MANVASQIKTRSVVDWFAPSGRCFSFYTPGICLDTPFGANVHPFFLARAYGFECTEEYRVRVSILRRHNGCSTRPSETIA
jgi:hypothetical protein